MILSSTLNIFLNKIFKPIDRKEVNLFTIPLSHFHSFEIYTFYKYKKHYTILKENKVHFINMQLFARNLTSSRYFLHHLPVAAFVGAL